MYIHLRWIKCEENIFQGSGDVTESQRACNEQRLPNCANFPLPTKHNNFAFIQNATSVAFGMRPG